MSADASLHHQNYHGILTIKGRQIKSKRPYGIHADCLQPHLLGLQWSAAYHLSHNSVPSIHSMPSLHLHPSVIDPSGLPAMLYPRFVGVDVEDIMQDYPAWRRLLKWMGKCFLALRCNRSSPRMSCNLYVHNNPNCGVQHRYSLKILLGSLGELCFLLVQLRRLDLSAS